MKHRLVVATAFLIVALVMSLPAILLGVSRPHAAALLKFNGQDIVMMSGEEFIGAMKRKDDEIAELKGRLDAKHKVECNLL